MRKFYLIALASISMFACSKNDSQESTDIPSEGIVFELATVNKLENGITSRTRPLYSQEAIQEVERVSIYAFKKNGNNYLYDTTYVVPNWSKGSTFMRFTIEPLNRLQKTDYQFLVVGRELTDNYTLATLTRGTSKITDITATVPTPGQESEIFAGDKSITVSSEGVRVSVEMTRKIAGILGYFKNVPAMIGSDNVKSLRLVMTNADKQVNLYSGIGSTPTTTDYEVFNIDLSGQTVTPEGVFAGSDLSGQGVVKVANSQLTGKFVLPVSNITMQLRLYGATNNILKTWNVLNNGNVTMDILANHFYALGQKVAKGDTTGGGTPDAGDDDAPIDLLKDQVIAITINPNWAQFHNLVIQ